LGGSIKDKLGDYGLVIACLLSFTQDSVIIEKIAMSCRVMQRGVENKFLQHIKEYYKKLNISNVKIKIKHTKYNKPFIAFSNSNFDKQNQINKGSKY